MELTINHQKKNFDCPQLSLEALMHDEEARSFRSLAVAVNQHVIPQNKWAETVLRDNDSILIITATQGG